MLPIRYFSRSCATDALEHIDKCAFFSSNLLSMGNKILYIISAVFMMGEAVFCTIGWIGYVRPFYVDSFFVMFDVIVSYS